MTSCKIALYSYSASFPRGLHISRYRGLENTPTNMQEQCQGTKPSRVMKTRRADCCEVWKSNHLRDKSTWVVNYCSAYSVTLVSCLKVASAVGEKDQALRDKTFGPEICYSDESQDKTKFSFCNLTSAVDEMTAMVSSGLPERPQILWDMVQPSPKSSWAIHLLTKLCFRLAWNILPRLLKSDTKPNLTFHQSCELVIGRSCQNGGPSSSQAATSWTNHELNLQKPIWWRWGC